MASGPSTNKADVDLLRGLLPVLAIKKNVELAPWAEVVYGCDYPWWKSVRGLPDFRGLKLSYDPRGHAADGVRKVDISLKDDRILMDRVGLVGAGGNSGFHALNLAVQFGAKRVLLIGFDCQDRSGVHWYGRNGWTGGNNPSESNFRRWRAALAAAAKDLESHGVEVVNASPITDLKCFPRWSVADTLKQWGLS